VQLPNKDRLHSFLQRITTAGTTDSHEANKTSLQPEESLQ